MAEYVDQPTSRHFGSLYREGCFILTLGDSRNNPPFNPLLRFVHFTGLPLCTDRCYSIFRSLSERRNSVPVLFPTVRLAPCFRGEKSGLGLRFIGENAPERQCPGKFQYPDASSKETVGKRRGRSEERPLEYYPRSPTGELLLP